MVTDFDTDATHPHGRAPRRLSIAISAAAILLSLLGIVAAVTRATIVASTLATPVQDRPALSERDSRSLALLEAGMHLEPGSPEDARNRADFIRLADKYVAHPVYAFMHLVPGILILLLAPLQFSERIRRRHLRFHRWSGRALLGMLLLVAISAAYLGVVSAQVVAFERPTIAIFTAFFVFTCVRAFIAIRRRDVARHREWMIRMFAMATGIATVRLVSMGLVLSVRAPYETLGVGSMWIGWLLTLGVAEAWICYTRRAGAGVHTIVTKERSWPLEIHPMARRSTGTTAP
jgi:uncharacterized membrane protein